MRLRPNGVGIGMAVGAAPIAEPVARHLFAAFQAHARVAAAAAGLRVLALERVASHTRVIEARQREALGLVAALAASLRSAAAKLACVYVVVAAGAVARRTAVAGDGGRALCARTRLVTAAAGRACVRTGEGPGGVIEARGTPALGLVAVRAAAVPHLLDELRSVRVRVAVLTATLRDAPGKPR